MSLLRQHVAGAQAANAFGIGSNDNATASLGRRSAPCQSCAKLRYNNKQAKRAGGSLRADSVVVPNLCLPDVRQSDVAVPWMSILIG
jgi:hypothetical protein